MSADIIARALATQARNAAALAAAPGPRTNSATIPLVQQLARTAAMIARVRANVTTTVSAVALMGDSTSFGTGASSRAKDYGQALASILAAAGVPAETDSIWGITAGFTYAAQAAYDSRFAQSGTGGLGAGGGTKSLAGNMYKLTATGDWVAFTPSKTVDRFDVWFPTGGTFGTFNVSIDGGAAQTVSQNFYGGIWTYDGTSWTQTTAPVATDGRFARAQFRINTNASHTIRITWATSAVQISGIHGYRSDLAQIGIYNWGRPGETAPNWAAGAGNFNVLAAANNGPLDYLPIDLVLLDLGINDANTGVTDAAFSTAMQQLITGIQTRGSHDLGLIVPVATNFSAISQVSQQGKWTAINALSAANANAPIVADMPQRWGNYAGGQPRGYYYDNTHPNDTGYADKAQAIARAVLGL